MEKMICAAMNNGALIIFAAFRNHFPHLLHDHRACSHKVDQTHLILGESPGPAQERGTGLLDGSFWKKGPGKGCVSDRCPSAAPRTHRPPRDGLLGHKTESGLRTWLILVKKR